MGCGKSVAEWLDREIQSLLKFCEELDERSIRAAWASWTLGCRGKRLSDRYHSRLRDALKFRKIGALWRFTLCLYQIGKTAAGICRLLVQRDALKSRPEKNPS